MEIREQGEMDTQEGVDVRKCGTCGSEMEEAAPMTQITINVGIKVAPDDLVLRAHVVDLVYSKLLDWLHEDSYEFIEPTAQPVDVLDTVIAYSIAGQQ